MNKKGFSFLVGLLLGILALGLFYLIYTGWLSCYFHGVFERLNNFLFTCKI